MKATKNAEKTRTLRGRPRKDRQEAGRSLRDLPASDEAQAKRKAKKVTESTPYKVVPMGKHHTIYEPVLQWERDDLLDKLWKAQKQQESWNDVDKYSFTYHNRHAYVNGRNTHTRNMMKVFNDYIEGLKKRLLSLDERISPIDGRQTLPHRNHTGH